MIYFITPLLLIGLMLLFCLGSPLRRIKENINSSDTKVTDRKGNNNNKSIFKAQNAHIDYSKHTHTQAPAHTSIQS